MKMRIGRWGIVVRVGRSGDNVHRDIVTGMVAI